MIELRSALAVASIGLLALASATACGASGDEAVASALLECAALSDDTRRLDCFDRATNRLNPAVEAAPPIAVSAAALPAAATLATTQATAGADDVGMTAHAAEPSPETEPREEPPQYTATVVEVHKRLRGEHVVTLDNGEIWTEKQAESGFRIRQGDTVTIRKGTFGGYRMVRGSRSSQVQRTN